MTKLAAAGLTVRRNGRAILADVAFEAQSGEFVAIVGANGAGKSTLLSALAGLLAPDEGAVTLDGKSLGEISGSELAKHRAYLPQNPRCEWPISVERLVALGLTPTLPAFGGLPDRAKIERALEVCDLVARREQAVTTLSGGELMRAMLARAFVGDPEILVVDEPVTGLDPRHALDTAGRLQSFARAGRLVIASLHDLTLAGRYASRIVALRDGKVECDGPPDQILTPALIRKVFDVESNVSTGRGGLYVDYTAPT
jgi:iron complex transport system ATP-binding protein